MKPLLILTAATAWPLFVWQIFRSTQGILGQITGAVNNSSRGFFDRNRKFRASSQAAARKRQDEGNRWRGGVGSNWRGSWNKGLQAISQSRNVKMHNPVTREGWRAAKADVRTAMYRASAGAAGKSGETSMAEWFNDDAKVYAARFDTREQMDQALADFDEDRFGGDANAQSRMDAIAQIMDTKRQMGAEAFRRARVEAQGKTGTGYQREVLRDGNGHEVVRDTNDAGEAIWRFANGGIERVIVDANGDVVLPEGTTMNTEFDAARAIEDLNEAYGDDRNGFGSALARMRSNLTNSGQVAGVASFGTWAGQGERLYQAQRDRHNGPDGERAYQAAREDAQNTVFDAAADAATPGQAIYGKPSSVREFARAHTRRIQRMVDGIAAGHINPETNAVYTQADLDQALASTMGIYDAMAQASPQNARVMANVLMNHQIRDRANPSPDGTISIFDFANADTTVQNEAYVRMRRDYSGRAQQAAAEARAAQAAQVGAAAGQQQGGVPQGGTNNPFQN